MGPKRGRTGGGPGTNQYEVKGASGAQPAAGRVDAFAAGPGLATCAGCPRRVPAGELVDELCPECTLDGREYDTERDTESYQAGTPATNEPVPARGKNARWDRAFDQARKHGATNDEATAFAQLVHGRALDESDEADVCGRFVELCRGGKPTDVAGRLVAPLIEELAAGDDDGYEPRFDDPGEEWWRQLEPGDEIRVGPNEDSWTLVEPPTIGPGGRLVVKASRPTGGEAETFGVDEIA